VQKAAIKKFFDVIDGLFLIPANVAGGQATLAGRHLSSVGKLGSTIAIPFRGFPANYGLRAVRLAVPELSLGMGFIKLAQGDIAKANEYFMTFMTDSAINSVAGLLLDNDIISMGSDSNQRARQAISLVAPDSSLNLTKFERFVA
jgi:hypothetical protein